MRRFPLLGPRDRGHWFRIGTVDVTTTTLVTVIACASFVVVAISPSLWPFDLNTQLVASGQVWRLLTWPLFNDLLSGSLWIVIAVAVFWWLGQRLETLLGARRCLLFYAILALIPALAITVFSQATGNPRDVGSGMYELETAVLVAFAAAYPRVRFFFSIEAWVIAIVFIAIDLILFAETRDGFSAVFLLITAAVALLTARAFRLTRAQWIPTIPLPSVVTGDASHRRERERKRAARAAHLHVVRQNDVDALLDKISQQGINSLSREERRRLEEYGRGSEP
jgi:signal transduction histidine kinase